MAVSKQILSIVRLWADENGESHFSDDSIELMDSGDIGALSRRFSSNGLYFRTTPGDYNFDWHVAPRRQFICNLDADVQITVSDGETRVIERGAVLFVEDVSGKGHVSKAVNGKPRTSLFIAVADDEFVRDASSSKQ